MNEERIDSEVEAVLNKALPEMSAGWRARAMAAVEAARDAGSRGGRWRIVALVGGAVIVLFSLGFVPVPLGRAPGALDKAMAALEGSTGMYMRTRQPGRDEVTEVWQAPGWLMRIETWEKGKLTHLSVSGADFWAGYAPAGRIAEVYDAPPARGDEPLGWVEQQFRGVATLLRKRGLATVREWRQASLWRGEVHVIEMIQRPGDKGERMRWVTQAATGRLISYEVCRLRDGKWKPTQVTEEVSWDVEIPSSAWTFEPPQGTTVTYHHWWKGRSEDILAEDQTPDWQVAVHSIEANEDGDLIVILSRRPTPEAQERAWSWNAGVTIKVAAVDDFGVAYEQENRFGCTRGYFSTTLTRSASDIPPGRAYTVTLTVHPYRKDPCEDQVLTFPDLPLPPLQEKVESTTEVIQY